MRLAIVWLVAWVISGLMFSSFAKKNNVKSAKKYADTVCLRALERVGYFNQNRLNSYTVCRSLSEELESLYE